MYPTIGAAEPSKDAKSSSSMYPTVQMDDLAEDLFPQTAPEVPIESKEEILIKIPGAIAHLIDRQQSIEIGCGEFSVARVRQGDNAVAVLARVADVASGGVQWPLVNDVAAVKLDDSHYFFSFQPPRSGVEADEDDDDPLNYGLTFAVKGQEGVLKELDGILDNYAAFSVQKVAEKADVLDGSVAKEVAPADIQSGSKKEMMEKRSAAYWTTLAPNVEDYSGSMARAIAAGSGLLIKGILWSGDVTVDRLKWGNDIMKRRMEPNLKPSEVSPEALKRIRRVKRVTKMSEKVATGILSGVVKISGFVAGSVANSKVGKKFFSLLPGELVLASLDGFEKVCDAVEVAGKNVLSTSSTVTTGLVSHRYGQQAGELTNESLGSAGHALGTAWAVFKIRKAFNPKSVIKPSTMAKAAAKAAGAELKSKKSNK